MPKRLTTEDHLALLRRLRESSPGPETTAALGELLTRKNLHGIVLKGAAALAQKFDARQLASLLLQHAQSLMGDDAQKRDPGCEAKTAITQALIEWEFDAPDFYVALAGYHQFAPTFGDPVDTAAECRGLSAIGLVRSRPENALDLLVDLLADPEKTTRANAALAIGLWPGPEAQPLLRLKARTGDESAEVLGEVFSGLLRIAPRNLSLVATSLASADVNDPTDTPKAEAAALALGQSKIPEALKPLTDAWPTFRRSPIAGTILLAIGLHRSQAAIDWLLAQIPRHHPTEAAQMLDALAPYRSDEKIRARVKQATQGNEELEKVFEQVFR